VSGKVNAKQLDVVSPFGVIMNTFVQLTALTVGTTITGSLGEGGGEEQKKMAAQRCPEVNGRRAPVCGPDSVTRKKATTKGQTAAAETTNSLYPGVALIISGARPALRYKVPSTIACSPLLMHSSWYMLLGVNVR
jgi:hypothetical protein